MTDTTAWEQKANAISEIIQQRHTPFKTILDPQYDSPAGATLQNYARAGDSAIWTGHYFAAEAFRYKVTASNQALANLQRTLEGLRSLVDITESGLLARCLFREDWEFATPVIKEECRHGIRRGTLNGESYLWVGNTSRDQYSGVFFGLGAAYDLVDDEDIRASIRALVTQLLEFLLKHLWTVVMPDGGALAECPGRSISTTFIGRPEQQLNFLQIGRHVNPQRFEREYRNFRRFFAAFTSSQLLLEALDLHGSYFKFNLAAINLYNLVRLEEKRSRSLRHYRRAYGVWRNAVRAHANAHFNMVDREVNGADAGRDQETIGLLDDWLKRPDNDEFIDLRRPLWNYPACPPPHDRGCSVIPVSDRVRTDFLWQRSPFLLFGGGAGTIKGSGIDFILPYWMARHYKVL
ncbi:MAG: hypothetical protein L0387_07245 [Acidobacteria bacterium]|nr:hypothetical protein [Acidobacteriota bacterium]MCI0720468.1 hypothetical protein [Acidobacteriota bacterium]